MADLVADGALFQCDKGGLLELKVFSSSATGESKKLAAKTNCMLIPKPIPCSMLYGAPCAPPATLVDKEAQDKVTIDGLTALGAGCKFNCALGGKISVLSTGQCAIKHDEAQGGRSAESVPPGTFAVLASHLWVAREGEKINKGENVSPAETKSDKANVEDHNINSIDDYRTSPKKPLVGTYVHDHYKKDLEDPENGREKEYLLDSGKKIDFLDYSSNPIRVYELKPNNPRQRREGLKQLKRYIEELKKVPEFMGRDFEAFLEVY